MATAGSVVGISPPRLGCSLWSWEERSDFPSWSQTPPLLGSVRTRNGVEKVAAREHLGERWKETSCGKQLTLPVVLRWHLQALSASAVVVVLVEERVEGNQLPKVISQPWPREI